MMPKFENKTQYLHDNKICILWIFFSFCPTIWARRLLRRSKTYVVFSYLFPDLIDSFRQYYSLCLKKKSVRPDILFDINENFGLSSSPPSTPLELLYTFPHVFAESEENLSKVKGLLH